ncbi:ATP-binding cassette domain-containing protein [Pseudomonas sp. F1_0610]|uniref:ATP-binding cassette domain-containing protein n=1 Tax=Pseudomonas sp. F1_0610 TaxID=3114284 RepID=UPI0039C074EF
MTMTCCQISQLTAGFEFPILQNLNFSLTNQLAGLVAPNGQGKSLLLRTLAQQLAPLAGKVQWQITFTYVAQQSFPTDTRLADALGIAPLYDAFIRIKQGSTEISDYNLIEANWHLPSLWQKLLDEAQLNVNLADSWMQLSGGQQQRLKLHFAFAQSSDFLLLDEPSNHLDTSTRNWLLAKLEQHATGALIASHDKALLERMQAIYQLNKLGIQYFTGNFSAYTLQQQRYENGLTQQAEQLKKQLKQEKAQQQARLEKQQRRQHEGQRLRKTGSQCKLFLDRAKDSAEQSIGQVQQAHEQRSQQLKEQLKEKQQQLIYKSTQSFSIDHKANQNGLAISIQQLCMPFTHKVVSCHIQHGEHWHIEGCNGSGKSTLLKLIAQQLTASTGNIIVLGKCVYLDQHFSMLNKTQSAYAYLREINPEISESQWRTLLAGFHLTGDKALQPIAQLSGGQQLKVALLAIAHQPQQPIILLLDEPENHLDLEAKQLLANTLANFQGTYLLVSHDTEFVKQAAIDQQLSLDN